MAERAYAVVVLPAFRVAVVILVSRGHLVIAFGSRLPSVVVVIVGLLSLVPFSVVGHDVLKPERKLNKEGAGGVGRRWWKRVKRRAPVYGNN